MNDSYIIELFNKRDERAIEETERQYGSYCTAIANRILQSREDAEECLNDTLLIAWNHIPPENPRYLSLYLGAIARNFALARHRDRNTIRRGGNGSKALDEIEAVIPSREDPEQFLLDRELAELINRFLRSVKEQHRNIFLCRYYYFYSVEEIAKAQGVTERNVRTILRRVLQKLRQYLEKEAYL